MKKSFFLSILISIIIFFCLPIPECLSWEAFKDVEDINTDGDFKVGYIDVDGDSINEIIIKKRYGAGSNHYLEDLRIFKDSEDNKELELIFHIVTLDSIFGFSSEKQYNRDIVSEVEFAEPTPENKGIRDIIVKSKKIYYKDAVNKVIDREEGLETKVFSMYGSSYSVNKIFRNIDLDNNGEKELVVAQQQYEIISENIPSIAMREIITVSTLDDKEIASFSMPDHMGEVEFISLNKDSFKQIVAMSYGGTHYTNIAIYGYKDGKLYEIFEDGSACGVKAHFDASPPTIKIGSANWGAKVLTEEGKEINWSYSSDPLWKIHTWNGEEFIYSKDLSTSPDFSHEEETKRYLDKARSLMTGDNNK
ncbi:MAG: hypothetical protein KKC11_08515 [Candidatus Omnitrophica bacterium]|nr:hypothetical protein [Candidatus Omnitrophota bacterium]MBU0878684.1 hypothetical protein [Candidatus Omnitrophota bacterium]MBU0896271.1 hypothetical protein [Candidatus Omnitrophota bacterium]MBU1133397.1 hypothetical protein [Candidatus Omnitrophota bacterium]MBU1809628.1 hypothetical protein [Candidatus Omnitrophota bacterium]